MVLKLYYEYVLASVLYYKVHNLISFNHKNIEQHFTTTHSNAIFELEQNIYMKNASINDLIVVFYYHITMRTFMSSVILQMYSIE